MFYIKHNSTEVFLNATKGTKPEWKVIQLSKFPYLFDTAGAGFNFLVKAGIKDAKPVCIVKHRVEPDDLPEVLYQLIERLPQDRIKVKAINVHGTPEHIFNIEEITDTF